MQAKDVPTLPILQSLRASIRDPSAKDPMIRSYWRTHWQDVESARPSECGQPWHLPMPPGTPAKVALAKMRGLLSKGLVDGCPCGCRGDWVITDKGLGRLAQLEARAATQEGETPEEETCELHGVHGGCPYCAPVGSPKERT